MMNGNPTAIATDSGFVSTTSPKRLLRGYSDCQTSKRAMVSFRVYNN